jgi:hypothetical protein
MFDINETNVVRHYDRGGFENESVRLDRFNNIYTILFQRGYAKAANN